VTEKHDAAHDTRGRHPENGLGLHYSRFSPISADRLLFPQLLAGSKIENPAANRPSQAKANLVEIGRHARLTKVVVDRGCRISEGLAIGEDPDLDARRFYGSEGGVTLVTAVMLAGLG
jgi:ADP-glucose pyrophosphorylase